MIELIYWIPIIGVFIPLVRYPKQIKPSLQEIKPAIWLFYHIMCGVTIMHLIGLI